MSAELAAITVSTRASGGVAASSRCPASRSTERRCWSGRSASPSAASAGRRSRSLSRSACRPRRASGSSGGERLPGGHARHASRTASPSRRRNRRACRPGTSPGDLGPRRSCPSASGSWRRCAPQVIGVPAAAFVTLTTNRAALVGMATDGAMNAHHRSPVAPSSLVHGAPEVEQRRLRALEHPRARRHRARRRCRRSRPPPAAAEAGSRPGCRRRCRRRRAWTRSRRRIPCIRRRTESRPRSGHAASIRALPPSSVRRKAPLDLSAPRTPQAKYGEQLR